MKKFEDVKVGQIFLLTKDSDPCIRCLNNVGHGNGRDQSGLYGFYINLGSIIPTLNVIYVETEVFV